jgi:hypothetical protein
VSAAPLQIERQCRVCGETVDLPLALYCPPCRSKRKRKLRKWVATEYIDRKIRQIYIERHHLRTGVAIPNLTEFAQQIGWPKWAVIRRARELGCARVKETPWSAAELQILEQFAWMCDESIRMRLKAAGFNRSATAVHLKIKRLGVKRQGDWYSGNSLAQCFGVDNHVPGRWIRAGYLKATMRGSERTERQGGDIYLIREKAVRDFVLAHPMEFDLRKVDQLWFLNMITAGKIAG